MLRYASILCVIIILLSAGTAVFAAEPQLPSLIITEIVADNESSDTYEYIEILNASKEPLNLYNYSIAYCADITSASYNGPNKKTEIVPGRFSTSRVDKSRAFSNPAEFTLLPGEVALIWFWNFDSYTANAKINDFRTYYNIGSDVKIVAIDADNSTATGNTDRFNLQNSGFRGIYIVKDDFVLNSGNNNIISMATLDYGRITSSMPDLAVVFGKSAESREIWRLTMTAFWAEPTPGILTESQRAEFVPDSIDTTENGSAAPTSDDIYISVIFLSAASILLVYRFKKKYRYCV